MKKVYERPTMNVVKLKQQQQLLSASNGVQSMRSGYGDAQVDTWDEFEKAMRESDK